MTQQPTMVQPPGLGVLAPADVWRIVRKRLWLIIACFVVLGLGGTAALVAWYYWAPFFTAEGVIEVEPGQGQLPAIGAGYQEQVPIQLFEPYMQAQVLAIKNDRVLVGALEQLKGKQAMYLGPGAAFNLGRELSVMYLPNTQNIFVGLRGRDKEQVLIIVREVLTQYIAQLKAERDQLDADRQRDLRLERDELRKQLDDLGRKLASYREESSVIVTDDRGSEQLARLTALTRLLSEAQVELAEATAAWNQFQELRKQAEEGKDLTPVLMAFPEVMNALRGDPTIAQKGNMASAYAQELAGLKQRFGPKHETVIRMETALQQAQNEYQTKQAEVLGQLFQQQAAVLKNKLERARAAEAELLNRVAEARAAAVSAAKMSAEYRTREDEYRRVQALLSTITDGLERMRIGSALSRPNIRVSRWPTVPFEPSEPRLWLYIPAAILFSLLVGLGFALAIEVMDTRLRTPSEVVRQVGVPLLGAIPDLSEDERLALDTNLAMVGQTVPQSLTSEAFRQARTNLLFASDSPVKTLLVTSPNPGDGKSIVASNLAITMARGGHKVLLIETNFRRPFLARVFDLPDAVGLSNVLVGLNTAAEAIQATRVENLDVLVCGAQPPSPGELLGSLSMKQLVQDQAERYDHVIIDGAPILVVADVHLLAERVDGVLMVYRAGENTRGLALRAARQVRSLRARLLGAILNRVRATKGGYFREAFQVYYDYSGAAAGASPASPRSASAAPRHPTP